MSGGSMDFAFLKVQEAAYRINAISDHRARFRSHLLLVAEALRCIEWVDSGDSGPETEIAAINKCFKEGTW